MMELKKRATREELFDADEFSVSWSEHQLQRIQRLHQRVSERLGIPQSSMSLCFEEKQVYEIFGRDGQRLRYRPKGLVLGYTQDPGAMGMINFDVAWVDPWGYAHSKQVSFIEIRLKSVTELDYRRALREYRQAVEKHWVGASKSTD